MPVYLSRQETGLDRYRLRGHRVGSGMPDDSLRSHARWSLRAVLLDIMPRHAQAAGAFLCCPHASPFGTGPKGAKARPLSLPAGAKESGAKKSPGRPRRSTATMRPCSAQRNLRVALGAARPQCGRAAPGRAPTCADRRRERKPPAAGTNPMTSCPSKRDPLVAPLLSSSVEGLKRFGSLLATPFRPPQGKSPFILPAR